MGADQRQSAHDRLVAEGKVDRGTLTVDDLIADVVFSLPPAVRRAADVIMSVWCKTPGPTWHEDAAVLVCSSGEIRDGLAALPVLEQLRERHTKRVWGGVVTSISEPSYQRDDRVTVCSACNVAWPCADAEILGVA